MSAGRARFDACVEAAENAASHFDGPKLVEAVTALSQCVEAMQSDAAIDADTAQHMRRRLERYQGLCLFLQQTLHQALTGAVTQSQSSCYVCDGAARDPAAPPIFRRYC